MMRIELYRNGQELRAAKPVLFDGAVGAVTVKVHERNAEESVQALRFYTDESDVYSVDITDGAATVPHEVIKTPGFTIAAAYYRADGENIEKFVPTEGVFIPVMKNGYGEPDDAVEGEHAAPSVLAQLLEKISSYITHRTASVIDHPDASVTGAKIAAGSIGREKLTAALAAEIDEKAKAATVYTKTEADDKLDEKVDKVAGKGLSANDYTDAEKAKVDDLPQSPGTEIAARAYTLYVDEKLDEKVDKADGKGLSTVTDIQVNDSPSRASCIDITYADGMAYTASYYDPYYIDNVLMPQYVKKTDYASDIVAGVVKYYPGLGIVVNADGTMQIDAATNDDIDKKLSYYKPITPARLDYALKPYIAKLKEQSVPHSEMSASPAVLTDALANETLRGLTVYGGCGKNLIPYPYASTTTTQNGITFTDNGDGSITVNGTATANVFYHLLPTGKKNLSPGKYVNNDNASKDTDVHFVVNVRKNNLNIIVSQNGGSFDISGKDYDIVWYVMTIPSGQTVDNVTFKPQIELGQTATEWEPYRLLGDADGDKYKIPVCCSGKNLISLSGRTVVDNWAFANTNKRTLTGNQIIKGFAASNYAIPANVTISEATDESITIVSKSNAYGIGIDVEVSPSTEYYISGLSGNVGRIMVASYDKDGGFIESPNKVDNFTFTTPAGAKWVVIALTATALIEGSVNSPITFSEIQLERGSVKSEYEPYSGVSKATATLDTQLAPGESIDVLNKKRYSPDGAQTDITVSGKIEIPESGKVTIWSDTQVSPPRIDVGYWQDINKVISEMKKGGEQS